MKISERITHAWNAFRGENIGMNLDRGYASSRPPYKTVTPFNASSFVSSIYNRIAIDVSMTKFKHVKVNPDNDDEEILKTGFHECLSVEANIDQSHIQFIHDLVYSMFDEGVVAAVPVETTISPEKSGGYDILSMRVGKIMTWYPKHVEVELYNEDTGINQTVTLEKRNVAIIENPLYSVVNDHNSTLKRLLRKINQLDSLDSLSASSRLDLMVSVPYGIKTDKQRQMAEKRIADIEAQLSVGKHGIAYIDGTEKIHQLNRPINSQLPENIEALTQEFYNQLGLTRSIFDGTAKEEEIRTYYSRSIDPIVEHIVSEFTRKFITKTGRTQGQKVTFYRDMFKMVPVESIAQLGDTFIRNRIAVPNEMRKIVGLRPSSDPVADEFVNPNMPLDKQSISNGVVKPPNPVEEEK